MLDILYWNTRLIPRLTHSALWAQGGFDVIALQEPHLQKTGTPACPGAANYRMVYSSGKAALYIHKRHGPGTWSSRAGENWCSATFVKDQITVYSVYNPNFATPQSTPLQFIHNPAPGEQIVLVGDFNLHHPLWDQYERESAHSDDLLQLAQRLQLGLITPKEECTRFAKGHRDSTIDLAWVSHTLPSMYKGSVQGLNGSDHIAQHIRIGQGALADQVPYYRWRELDQTLVEAEATARLGYMVPPTSANELDEQVDHLLQHLEEIAVLAVPKRPRAFAARPPWWSRDIAIAQCQSRRAARRYRARPNSEAEWQSLLSANKNEKKVVSNAMRKSWREFTEEASKDSSKLWALQRWARLRSGLPPPPAHLPSLVDETHPDGLAQSFEEKTQTLARRFFPGPQDGAIEVPNPDFCNDSFANPFEVCIEVTVDEVLGTLKRAKPWKAPGQDGIPTGFLKACGRPLAERLAVLIQASLTLEWFPSRFRAATVIVLPKPGKTPQQKLVASGWRPISLLNTVGKVFESVISSRITAAAEEHGLLPEEQMGNRAKRSTILATQVLIEAVRSAWGRKGVASLLQLDLKGAFDSVSHMHLLHTLRQLGYPPKIVRWVQSYLSARVARLRFDGQESELLDISTGVPQGSPLSPILFILFISSLYRRLQDLNGLLLVGFADDTNLLSIARTVGQATQQLAEAWEVCASWAQDVGMQFEPAKSELMHFTRTRAAALDTLSISGITLRPTQEARFLGVWLHRKLLWGSHLGKLMKKLSIQKRALTGIAASTWGCSLDRAREVYTKVIRTAIAYGAAVYHTPTETGGRPKGIARSLMKQQSDCLRAVLGAYKATPVRQLEVEAGVPPLDIYLNSRVAANSQRLEDNGMASLLRGVSTTVASILRRRQRRRGRPAVYRRPDEETQLWQQRWMGEGSSETSKRAIAQRVEQEWQRRWTSAVTGAPPRYLGDTQAADFNPVFTGRQFLLKHKEHPKFVSSMITQLRTGRVGLRAFLFQRRVPSVMTPLCSCGVEPETTYHVFLRCPLTRTWRTQLPLPLGRAEMSAWPFAIGRELGRSRCGF